MATLRDKMRYLNPYDVHKLLINEYVLNNPGDTKFLKRDSSKDRNDYHVIKENHKFLWDESESIDSWEKQFAKKYYDKLFKEYCIADLTFYKENKVALRWRTEKEVVVGKGQFSCGNKTCIEKDLRTWEVNFGYIEQGQKKNALVKLRLCPDCSNKLNYHSKKREVKRLQKKTELKHRNKKPDPSGSSTSSATVYSTGTEDICIEKYEEHISEDFASSECVEKSAWENHKLEDVKSRDEEMDEYLQNLLL